MLCKYDCLDFAPQKDAGSIALQITSPVMMIKLPYTSTALCLFVTILLVLCINEYGFVSNSVLIIIIWYTHNME
jgi:hypothetical protein